MASGLIVSGWPRRLLFLLIGVIGALGFAPWNLAPLMILSLAALLWGLERVESRKSAFALGWWWGLGNFLFSLAWIAEAFTFASRTPLWLAWPAVVILSLIMALYPGVSAAVAVRFRKGRLARTFAFAGAWVLVEWLRFYLFSGFGWNALGVVSLTLGGLAQLAAAIGTQGLSLMVIFAAAGVACLIDRRWRLGGALLAPLILGSVAPLFLTEPTRHTGVRLDIIQANIRQDEKYGPGATEAAIRRYAALTPPPVAGEPRLLIWPEAAIPELLDERELLRRVTTRAVTGPDDLFLVGAMKAIRDELGFVRAGHNSLFVLSPTGDILDRYDKTRLVPYGEYLPMRPLLSAIGLSELAPSDIDTWPGTGARTLRLPGFPNVVGMICYEVIFPEAASSEPRPRWLLNVSNDAWFTDDGAEMHLAQARMRSIEQGLPMARSTPTGISAVIDPWGRVTAALERHVAGRIVARLPVARPETPFAKIGTPLPLGLALFCLTVALCLPVRRH
ncbi:MAG: apolipoprotein N-acyltransferase [Pacificimonas sp.]